MTDPESLDYKRAMEALAEVYRILAGIGRRVHESHPDSTGEQQPDEKRAA